IISNFLCFSKLYVLTYNENNNTLKVLPSIKLARIQCVDGGVKMTDENNSKPFYKKTGFWIAILSVFVVVSATTFIVNDSYYQDKADQTAVTKKKLSKKIENNPSLAEKYDSIKTGKKGFSKKEVIELLGQPTATQTVDVTNQVDNLTWNGYSNSNAITVQISFQKDKATSKSIQGLDIDRKKLLTLADYDKIQEGDNYNQVVDILGDPDNYSVTNG